MEFALKLLIYESGMLQFFVISRFKSDLRYRKLGSVRKSEVNESPNAVSEKALLAGRRHFDNRHQSRFTTAFNDLETCTVYTSI